MTGRAGGEREEMALSQSAGTQDWRAIAHLASGGERLLCVGESSSQVRAAYVGAWGEVIRDEDRPSVQSISLQRWTGLAWSGQWENHMQLEVPVTQRNPKPAANGEKAEAKVGAED